MSNKTNRETIEQIAATIEIPETAYEKAENRYKDLGEWFGRPQAKCSKFDPHIYAQGSFRLGTVVRPLNETDEYDLDLGCRLRQGVSKSTHTQKQLKMLVGVDLEDYRKARGIKNNLEEKRRCWRLQYADEMSFHMDAVPSIPEEARRKQSLNEAMVKAGSATDLALRVAGFAGAITDNRRANYAVISPDWRVSNSEGYALWFESRMKLAMALLEKRAFEAKAAQVDDLPARKWKSPLQQCVQILKRHRDVMFSDDPDGQPISIIITTLAARAYQGETDTATALERILTDMGSYVRRTSPRVPNPVNPFEEDFADKWADPKYRHLDLETKFWWWLDQAQADFEAIGKSRDANFIVEQAKTKFSATLDSDVLKARLGLGSVHIVTAPKIHTIAENPAKPWAQD